ncbi:hypothetical protein BWI17_14735 [Betaproteobacteria bacterium GR16-43]|nr:hypothetical protein BWI17_14735 [Betaproteobacteria bacterium GR16-43]
MRITFEAAPGAMECGVQFSDWDRAALNGNSLGLFAWVSAGGTAAVPREIVLRDGASVLARLSPLYDTAEIVAKLAPGATGRTRFAHACVNRLALREQGAIAVEVVDEAGVRALVGRLVYAGNDLRDIIPPIVLDLAPVLVTSLGRSGSTILSQALGAHPALCTVGGYPFEYRFFSYCLHAALVLTSPAGHAHSMGGDSFEDRHPSDVGFNPFNHRDYDRALGHDGLREFYEGAFARDAARFLVGQAGAAVTLAAAGKPGATGFVEKMSGFALANFAHNACAGTREIVLTRGFEDLVRSMLAFDRQRGTTNFFDADSPEAADAWLMEMAYRQAHLAGRAREAGLVHVAYEELVGDPRARLTRLAKELEIDANPAAVEAMCAPFDGSAFSEAHSTAASKADLDLEAMFSKSARERAAAFVRGSGAAP